MSETSTKCLRHVFIGYDEREDIAYEICKYSILSQVDPQRNPVMVHKLDHKTLRKEGLFNRKWTIEENGSYKDNEDNKPFSTQFSHSRFLVPAYAQKLGLEGQALFIDCDFLFKGDINDLFDYTEAHPQAFHCVKHEFKSPNETKMDDCKQHNYTYKLWTALFMFNLNSKAIYEMLTPVKVNKWDGGALHRFLWISRQNTLIDSEIGEIPEEWHFVPNHSEERVSLNKVRAIHYTEGGPWFKHMEDCKYANDWWNEYSLYIQNVLLPYVDNKTKESV
jgi:lipopolysaccharide biosynthesis glycosyltransferase